VLLLASSLHAAATASGPEVAADLVVVNGKILTVDASFRVVSAVAIKDGVFAAIGSDAEIRRHVGTVTRVLDAGGRTVVPGLIESHVHATGAARGEALQPFAQLHSIGEIQAWLRRKVQEAKPGSWLQLPRVDATRVRERRIPTSAEMDAAAPDHPAIFTWQYANRQVLVLNRAAIRASNLAAQTSPPSGTKIHLGPDGQPTGVVENGGALFTKFLSRSAPEEQYLDSLARLLRRYNELGITSIVERTPRLENYRTFRKLQAEGRLPLRVTVTAGIATDGSVPATEKAIRALPHRPGEGDDWVRVGPLKFSVDGGLLYGTAYLREPYGEMAFKLYGFSDPAYRGDLRVSPDKIRNIIGAGHRLGWQMSTHVTGDAGVDAVLDAIESISRETPMSARRFNLLHAYFSDPATAQRAARLGVAVDTQPAWYYKDADALAEALGPRRMTNFIGVRTWREGGVKVALNSDHMQGFDPDTSLNPFNPYLAFAVAVTRRTEGGQLFGPGERVTREAALRMLTIDAAWLTFDEPRRGSIEVGKLGDLAILTDHILTCPEDRLRAIRARVTVVGGRIVHEQSP
jgi:predicted amidohydrolase YtcJ